MRTRTRLLASAVVLNLLVASAAEAAAPALPPGVALLGDVKSFRAGGASSDVLTMTPVDVPGRSFGRALRVTTSRRPANAWAAQLTTKTTGAMKRGDAVLIRFWARAHQGQAETGEARSTVIVERAAPPFDKPVQKPLTLTPVWQQFQFGFAAPDDRAAGEMQVNFHAGFDPQSVEIAAVELINYGTTVNVKDLPGSLATYPGRNLDAAWRTAAADRIDKLRKADLRVRVTDAGGKPVAAARVRVEQQRHAFPFGTAVTAERIVGTSAEDEQYRRVLRERFNSVVFENDLKWPQWEQPGRQALVERAITWLSANNLPVRGHCLVWPGWASKMNAEWKYLPADLKRIADEKSDGWQASMRQRIDAHVTNTATALKGKLVDWDVVNESWSQHDLLDLLGREEMVRWFKLARAADPSAKLYYNDFTMLSGGAVDPDRIDHLHDTIRFLKEKGAPLDGIGEQAHFGNTVVEPERVLAILDRFAKFGLPIRITEFDINAADPQLQADYTRDFYTAAFSHPAVNGIWMWGFWERAHWMPEAAMYRADFSPKPNAVAYEQLVYRQWWTTAELTTDARGEATVRGFMGDYQVTADLGDRGKPAVNVTLGPAGSEAEIKLPGGG